MTTGVISAGKHQKIFYSGVTLLYYVLVYCGIIVAQVEIIRDVFITQVLRFLTNQFAFVFSLYSHDLLLLLCLSRPYKYILGHRGMKTVETKTLSLNIIQKEICSQCLPLHPAAYSINSKLQVWLHCILHCILPFQ